MKLVITVVGKDRVGIIAAVTKILAENEVNILSINQNISPCRTSTGFESSRRRNRR